jgi:hypothetical protein
MPRVQNVFHNIVTDENSTTELLCNLLQFDDFRVRFLQLILPGVDSSEVVWDHIETQIDHGDFGRPDIQIQNGSVLALIEVKVVASLDTTANQPLGYMNFLLTQNEPTRRLVFLVPSDWFKLKEFRQELQRLGTDAVQTHVFTWDDVVNMIDAHVHAFDMGKPFIEEFKELLVDRVAPKPVAFTSEEIEMLFSKQVPSVLSHLQQVMDGIEKRGSEFKVRREGTISLWTANDGLYYGLYFQTPEGKDAFWFGVGGLFWEEHGFPLSFGVKESWGTAVKKAFHDIYKRATRPAKYGYTLGWVDKQVLDRSDAVSEIWSLIEPSVQATVAARRLGPERDNV